MKKKIILSLLVIITLFTITGCGNTDSNNPNNNNTNDDKNVVTIQGDKYKLKTDQTLNNLHYKENYVDFHSDAIGNMRTMSYTKQGNLVFEVRVMYDENKSLSELKTTLENQTNAKEQSKEINNIKYTYYDYKNENNLTVHIYMYVYNGKTYSICFFLGNDFGNIEEVFMNNISFG